MYYSNAAENDAISQKASAAGFVSTEQIVDAYTEFFRSKMQTSLQDMIFHAAIGIALLSMGPAFLWST